MFQPRAVARTYNSFQDRCILTLCQTHQRAFSFTVPPLAGATSATPPAPPFLGGGGGALPGRGARGGGPTGPPPFFFFLRHAAGRRSTCATPATPCRSICFAAPGPGNRRPAGAGQSGLRRTQVALLASAYWSANCPGSVDGASQISFVGQRSPAEHTRTPPRQTPDADDPGRSRRRSDQRAFGRHFLLCVVPRASVPRGPRAGRANRGHAKENRTGGRQWAHARRLRGARVLTTADARGQLGRPARRQIRSVVVPGPSSCRPHAIAMAKTPQDVARSTLVRVEQTPGPTAASTPTASATPDRERLRAAGTDAKHVAVRSGHDRQSSWHVGLRDW